MLDALLQNSCLSWLRKRSGLYTRAQIQTNENMRESTCFLWQMSFLRPTLPPPRLSLSVSLLSSSHLSSILISWMGESSKQAILYIACSSIESSSVVSRCGLLLSFYEGGGTNSFLNDKSSGLRLKCLEGLEDQVTRTIMTAVSPFQKLGNDAKISRLSSLHDEVEDFFLPFKKPVF